ncbi:MAG: bifunctional phosphoserine phosphatase/homoserine phosphotransferase ThrH [Deltaproteobacteria bacterium]|nr:MAG: bifunctional phosphoserine phosphatase/homoserine phosphotransferase ThrH [Deltaproteobacteria bacterium]
MIVACLDLEGVLIPEIWINFADKTGIKELRLTTRDIPDYDVLMKKRLGILKEHNLKLKDIQDVIATLSPLDGAADFLNWLRSEMQVVILSDTFSEFAKPFMKQLVWPTLFCHSLEVNSSGDVVNYKLRMKDQKRAAVEAFRSINLSTIAAGDSYNDTSMLGAADAGILFCPPDNVIKEFPQFPVALDYQELRRLIETSRTKI